MSKSFDPRYVLRQVSNELLEDLLEGQSQTVDVPWNELKETQIEPIFAAWQSMPIEPRRAIELILHDVFSIANDHGVRAIMEEANRQGNTSLLDDLAGDVSRFDIAMRTCLQADAVWSIASQFAKADEVSGGRYWIRRTNVPEGTMNVEPDNVVVLQKAIAAFYQAGQGRGRQCVIEHLIRADGSHYFFAYLDDYTDTYLKVVDSGKFARVCETHAFQVLFVLSADLKTLDIFVHGGKQVYEPLQQIFTRVILSIELPPEDPDLHPYALGVLLDPKFSFPTDPADGIVSVEVVSANIRAKGGSQRRMVLKPDQQLGPRDFQSMIDQWVNTENVPRSIMHMYGVTLRFNFDRSDVDLPPKMQFSISCPNRCSLKNLPDEQRELGERYLKLWGIDRAVDSEVAVSAA